MTTNIQVDRAGVWEDIDYSEFTIENGVSDILIAPKASVTTSSDETINANQPLRIQIDGTTRFIGSTISGGVIRTGGQRKVKAEHDGYALMNESVNITGTTDSEQVLLDALADANSGADFTLDYVGTTTALDAQYTVEDRSVNAVFKDIMDRTNRIWWMDSANVIHVETRGNRGSWETITIPGDSARVDKFDEGNVKTVRNRVLVNGTRGLRKAGVATDQTSIDTYGEQFDAFNVTYINTQAEAQNFAQQLLIPDPLSSADVRISSTFGTTPEQNLANYQIDLTDNTKGISGTFVVEKQVIEQGQIRLMTGEGVGIPLNDSNRRDKSNGDTTEPGSVYDTDRIAADAITQTELVDASVIESKLADAAVATAKLQNNAVINGKLDDLSVSETKIQSGSISTPKLQVGAVTANEIAADTITASEIAAGTITALEIDADTITASEIAAGTITALEIAADTLTANEVSTLDLNTGELSITDAGSGIEFISATFDGETYVTMAPTSDEIVNIGSDTRKIANIHARDIVAADSIDSNAHIASGASPVVRPDADNKGQVGVNGSAWDSMWAYDYIDASTGTALDGGNPTANLQAGDRVPEHARIYDDSDDEVGVSINRLSRTLWDIVTHQQDQINDLEQRISALEDPNA